VLASHEHQYYNPYDPNNVMTVPPFTAGGPTRYLVSGGAGAPFWADQPDQPPIQPQPWAFHHYLLFEEKGGDRDRDNRGGEPQAMKMKRTQSKRGC
jgi:hypothetical protein